MEERAPSQIFNGLPQFQTSRDLQYTWYYGWSTNPPLVSLSKALLNHIKPIFLGGARQGGWLLISHNDTHKHTFHWFHRFSRMHDALQGDCWWPEGKRLCFHTLQPQHSKVLDFFAIKWWLVGQQYNIYMESYLKWSRICTYHIGIWSFLDFCWMYLEEYRPKHPAQSSKQKDQKAALRNWLDAGLWKFQSPR